MLDSRYSAKAIIQIITPEMAAHWLRNNTANRAVSRMLVKEYARAMLERRWRTNGETIKISSHGRLIDGQHRLMACIEANCSFESYVVMGIDNDTFDTVDIGRRRTAGDIIGIDGCRNATSVAAAIRWLKLIREGSFKASNLKMSADEVRLFLASEPSVEISVAQIANVRNVMAPGLAGALHYLFKERDGPAADLFFLDLATGSNLVSGDSVLILRERLLKDKMSRMRMAKTEIAAICIRAWNHRRLGNTTHTLKGSITGANGDRAFPEVA
jgi:hypothetical protein